MALASKRDPVLTADGELVTGREALQVPVGVRVDADAEGATLELEARQAAAPNRTVRVSDLSATQLRELRAELDAALSRLE